MYREWKFFFEGTKKSGSATPVFLRSNALVLSFHESIGKHLRTHPSKSAGDYTATDRDRAPQVGETFLVF
jgi:hypothetical protein